MEKILELLMKKYSLLRDSLTNDQTILTINLEIMTKLIEFYQEKPLEFRYLYKKLKQNNEDITLVDLIEKPIEKQVEYILYKNMQSLLKKENNQKQTFLNSNKKYIYYNVLIQIKNSITSEKYLELKTLLSFLDIETSNDILQQKHKKTEELDEKLAMDRICVLECRSIQKKLEDNNLSREDKSFYQTLEQAFLSSIHIDHLKEALLSELHKNPNIISFPDTKKRTMISTR